jgi:hypothetical protein
MLKGSFTLNKFGCVLNNPNVINLSITIKESVLLVYLKLTKMIQ